jgi:hypothetical protein
MLVYFILVSRVCTYPGVCTILNLISGVGSPIKSHVVWIVNEEIKFFLEHVKQRLLWIQRLKKGECAAIVIGAALS